MISYPKGPRIVINSLAIDTWSSTIRIRALVDSGGMCFEMAAEGGVRNGLAT
jgi:hypothetical protein